MDFNNKKQYLNQLIEQYALFIISVLFILLILLKIILSQNFFAPFIFQDEIIYDSLAHNLQEGKLYAVDGGSYSPGYPIFLSIAYWIANDKETIYHIMLAISAIVTTSIIFPSYFILRKYCSTFISLIGSLAVTTLPFMNFYSFTIMTEVLFIPLFLFSIWFLLKSYETNDKKWELLATLSVVYLYITRSNGISMLIAFVLAFTYYLIINRKKYSVANLIKKKSFLIGTFIIFLCSWIIFSTHVTDINNLFSGNGYVGQIVVEQPVVEQKISTVFGYGSTYNIFIIFMNAINMLTNVGGLLDCFKYLIYLIDYLFLSSYFFIFVAIFFLAILFLHKIDTKDNYSSIVIVYIFATILILILSSVGFTIQLTENQVILGRYIEPVLPAVIILGIISINNINFQMLSTKSINIFISIFILLVFLVLLTFMYDNTIIFSFFKFC